MRPRLPSRRTTSDRPWCGQRRLEAHASPPDGIRSQIEGSLLWGLSSTFYEEATLVGGRLGESNFDTYKWQKNTELPELDIHIVENGVHPSGSGENTLSLVAPAICNAIYNLTGERFRSLPLKHHLPIV